ncbi:MAG: pyridoxamine 5'-phosphate oxidase [Bdellovibrionales bacterium GWB1_55_8]|nr:MAG: pyridoxamine 5'-phosphate oxidase [Bdellovibrionales bacterium GWB1_55_8]
MTAFSFPRGFTKDPIDQFRKWYEKARKSGCTTADIMTVATATTDAVPSARAVLFKGIENGGFVFFTNYKSRKGRELNANPRAAAVFLWSSGADKAPNLQIRIEGEVQKLSRAESEKYFQTRERKSQIAAWISLQSSPVPNFHFLQQAAAEMQDAYSGRKVPCPPFWGGYAIYPASFEFWRAGKYRLNLRVRYKRRRSGWSAQVLAP